MNNISLLNKEGLEFLSELEDDSIDLVLTDPPYEISRSTGFQESQGENTIERFKMSYEFGDWDEQSMDLAPFVQEMYRVLKPHGTCIIFYDLWKITPMSEMMKASKFKQLRFLEWVKTNPVPINSKINYLTNSREIALLGVKKSKPTFNSEYDNAIYRYPIYHGKDRFHPTQKSVRLFEDLIKKHSNENDIVLDCFAGSATTAIACINTNRSFIGCEVDEPYYVKAQDRIDSLIDS
tara:strand:+ start:478 stop:1185 length:708 start_codon:yes stop_codon:yes gene_type:complete